MESINIEDKQYELKFGFKFLKRANDKYYDVRGKDKVGLGVPMIIGYLSEYDPMIIPDIVEFGLAYLDVKPSRDKIEMACEELLMEQGIGAVSDSFLELFKEHKLHGEKTKQMLKKIQESETPSTKMESNSL